MALSKTHQPASRRFAEGFAKVRLRLAREHGHPQGSQEHGYDLVMPLDDAGRIDARNIMNHPTPSGFGTGVTTLGVVSSKTGCRQFQGQLRLTF